MPPSRRAGRLFVGLVVAVGLCGCDTLAARRRASQAAGLYRDGQLAAAAELYEQARALDPSIATVHLNLGFTYLSLYEAAPKAAEAGAHAEGAVRELSRYIALRPEDPRGRQYLIQTFVDSKRYDDAVAFFQPELSRQPPSLEAIALLGQIAAKVGRFEDALRWYERRVELSPGETEGLEGLGVLIWDHLHNHPEITGAARIALADRGVAALTRAVGLKPAAAEAYSYWNLLLRERATGHLCAPPTAGVVPAPPAAAVAPAPPARVAPARRARAAPARLVAGVAAAPLAAGDVGDAGGVPDPACLAKARDLLEADRLMRVASDLFRARAAAPAKGTR